LSSIIISDFDFDGEPEYLYQSNDMNVYIHRQNGMVFELDYLSVSWNYLDSMTRVREYYHKNGKLASDTYPRKAFVEHFFKFTKHQGADCLGDRIQELCPCPGFKYDLLELKREQRKLIFVFQPNTEGSRRKLPVKLEKQYTFKKNTIVVTYRLHNVGEKNTSFHFGSEINLSFFSPLKENLRMFDSSKKSLSELYVARGENGNIKKTTIEDKVNAVTIELTATLPYLLFNHILSTNARENGKIGEQFQALCLFPSWAVRIEPQAIWEATLEMSIQKMP
jgi:hypothetical protein